MTNLVAKTDSPQFAGEFLAKNHLGKCDLLSLYGTGNQHTLQNYDVEYLVIMFEWYFLSYTIYDDLEV